jgi:hypothetical protein
MLSRHFAGVAAVIMRSSVLVAALCFAAPCLAVPAHAEVTWSMPGSVCTWDEAASESKPLKIGLAAVQHKGSAKGVIALNCPISNYSTRGGQVALSLTYQDSTGTPPAASVKATLYAMRLEGSEPADTRGKAFREVPGQPIVIAEANSDDSSATALNTLRTQFESGFAFDFDTYTYWVHVELTRSAGTQLVIFQSVYVDETRIEPPPHPEP